MPKRSRVLENTCQLLAEARKTAYANAKLPCPAEEKPRQYPLLPVTVQDTEHLLYKVGDPAWADPKAVATRLSWTLGLQEKEEKPVEEEFQKAITGFKKHAVAAEKGFTGLNTDLRVLLPVYVKRGNMVLRDELDFHIGSLNASGMTMAAALQQYALDVCRDLGLNTQWFGAIMKGMGTVISYVMEEVKNTGTSEFIMPKGVAALRQKPHDLPVVEEVNPERDAAEKERLKRFQERAISLRQRPKEVAGAGAAVGKAEGGQSRGAPGQPGSQPGPPGGQVTPEPGQDTTQPAGTAASVRPVQPGATSNVGLTPHHQALLMHQQQKQNRQ